MATDDLRRDHGAKAIILDLVEWLEACPLGAAPQKAVERARAFLRVGATEPTSDMLDAGQHVLSEHLDDEAPLRERNYREPARAAWLAMQAVARGETVAVGPPIVRGALGRNLK